ncbi:MAG: hypothetical protein LBK77_07065, partial [Spirochaetaceae bacterium]|nr:hypothetical protein [Spirochaetaceae bacterium]
MAKIKTAALLSIAFLLSSCAISKALYLGQNDYGLNDGVYEPPAAGGEDINGAFPEAVYVKTRTQTFNAYHYYILHEGRIWYKSIDPEKKPEDWTLFAKTGLPHNPMKSGFNNPERIVEISADADEMAALSNKGGFYRYCFDRILSRRRNVWFDRQGWPGEEQLRLDRRTSDNLDWALGKRNSHVLYYEDPFGNQHHNGTMEIATTYILLKDGQEICYGDTGLPSDFSRNYTGPERGAFRACALSASASTMFVINEAGEMYTRLADFDTTGCDPMWFKYTYVPYQSDLPGTNYFSNLNEWGLPPEDWRYQPRIPLAGKAAVTRHITILQNGHGNGARELRVAGRSEAGETGYWTKAIFEDEWQFRPVPLYFDPEAILEKAASGDTRAERGLSPDKRYSGYYWNNEEKENDWEYTIPNFNILEGSCDLHITWRGETCALKLYPVEMWTYLRRDYLPGRTGSPKVFLVTLEIPENAFDGLSAEFAGPLAEKYAKNHRALFHYTLAASDHYIVMTETAGRNAMVYLTDETVSNQYSELPQTLYTSYAEHFDVLRRYYSPELVIDDALTGEDLAGKIELNEAFRDELRYQVRGLKWSKLTAFKFNMVYLPAHYLALMTPLRFVDIPKIRTITKFGDRLVLANSAYIDAVSAVHIWVNKKVIGLLELRLLYYNDLARRDPPPGREETAVPPWYSENVSDYWDIAGLPRSIRGSFVSPRSYRTNIPAVLTCTRPGTNSELLGWYLSIGESESYTLFVDPRNSPGALYKRKGKTPQERAVTIDCVIYIPLLVQTASEQTVIEQSLKPFVKTSSGGIRAKIIFDGEKFEIREYPGG